MRDRKFVLIIIVLLFTGFQCISCRQNMGTISQTPENMIFASNPGHLEQQLDQFYLDSKIPEDLTERLTLAIMGDIDAQNGIFDQEKNRDDFDWSLKNALFPFRNRPKSYTMEEILYNIGDLYYDGDEYIDFAQNKQMACQWYGLAAHEGSFYGAIRAGDMAREGDGILVNPSDAFAWYTKALEIEANGLALERMGLCYEQGIGTGQDLETASSYYLKSAFSQDVGGLYRLSKSENSNIIDKSVLQKAASSLDYGGGYFAIAYGGLNENLTSERKRNIVYAIQSEFDADHSQAADILRERLICDEFFSEALVADLIKTVYSYSYHMFAEEYGVTENRTYDESRSIIGSNQANEEDLNWEEMIFNQLNSEGFCYYEMDFDNDGSDEIGVSVHSGSGGAFMSDGFAVLKKNEDGSYRIYASGPSCALRDGMRIIQYDGRIYFIVNRFSDNLEAPYNIEAYTIDESGAGHTLRVVCDETAVQIIASESNQSALHLAPDFLEVTGNQFLEAIAATKEHRLYHPFAENDLPIGLTDKWLYNYEEAVPQDILFEADINNDNTTEIIHKGHQILQSKYYDEYYLFQVFDNQLDLENDLPNVEEEYFQDDYFGQHSGGNLYHLLPVAENIVQFWIYKDQGQNYSMVLTRKNHLYGANIYLIKGEHVELINQRLFFDTIRDVEITIQQP